MTLTPGNGRSVTDRIFIARTDHPGMSRDLQDRWL
jgi:hypothetical protein